MAIRKHTARDPFLDRESAIKALEGFIDGTQVNRGGMYLLQIINTLIQDGKEIYRRLPQSVFGGLPEGGRRNVQAAVLCRAVCGAKPDEQGESLPSGYTKEQEVVGRWAEKDRCWTDTAEENQSSRGRFHDSRIDGSEATVYFDAAHKVVYKNINHIRYPSLSRFLDRIAIHNALFPETTMRVQGFGIQEFAEDNSAFCTVVRQALVKGETPTELEIERSMVQRGMTVPEFGGGWFYETPDHEILVTDVHENNCMKTSSGNIIVFDCEAMVNDIPGFGGRYVIPEVTYGEESVHEITRTVKSFLPLEVSKEGFLASLKPEDAYWFKRRLDGGIRINGLVPSGRWAGRLVQLDPNDKKGNTLLIGDPKTLRTMFDIGPVRTDAGKPLDETEKNAILEGREVRRENYRMSFDLDRGRIVVRVDNQLKQKQSISQEKTARQAKIKM